MTMVCPITEITESLVPTSILLTIFIAVKRHHDHSNSYKENIWGGSLEFRGLVHHHNGVKHGSIQTDMVLGMELRVQHIEQAAEEECHTGPSFSIWDLKAWPQWHTSSNNVTLTFTRQYLLIATLQKSLWDPFSFKPPNFLPWPPQANSIKYNYKSSHSVWQSQICLKVSKFKVSSEIHAVS